MFYRLPLPDASHLLLYTKTKKGCLTSDAGATDPKSPEAAIVKLLKAAHTRRKEAAAVAAGKSGAGSAGVRTAPSGAKDAASLAFPRMGGAQDQLLRPVLPGGFTAGAAAQPPFGKATGAGVGPFGGVPGRYGGGGHGSDPTAAPSAAGSGPVNVGAVGKEEGKLEAEATGTREEVEALLVDGKKEEVCGFPCCSGVFLGRVGEVGLFNHALMAGEFFFLLVLLFMWLLLLL